MSEFTGFSETGPLGRNQPNCFAALSRFFMDGSARPFLVLSPSEGTKDAVFNRYNIFFSR